MKKLESENKKLRQELEKYRDRERKKWERRWFIAKKSSTYFLGSGLKNSIKKVLTEISSNKRITSDSAADLIAHSFWRITRLWIIGVFIAIIPGVLLIIQTIVLKNQNNRIDVQNNLILEQVERLDQQTNLQEAERRSSLVFLFSNILDKIDEEIKEQSSISDTPPYSLSDQLVARIISLSRGLKPYKYLENDSLTSSFISPERGQLLIALHNSKLDSITMINILTLGDFSYSDLRSADLSGVNWSSSFIDTMFLEYISVTNPWLSYTDNGDVVLNNGNSDSGIIVNNAVFDNVYLQGIKLSHANLENAILSNASLSGADLSHANLENAKLDFANLFVSNLQSSNLSHSDLHRANLSHSDLRMTRFDSARIWNTNLESANIKGGVFNYATIVGGIFQNAILTETKFDSTVITNFSSNLKRSIGLTATQLINLKEMSGSLPQEVVDSLKILRPDLFK
ncbi:MAG: hypothetical protein GYB31_20085 [Bacteroidetes bacterium]|nr:hypothetical protein [Bacteroidota bacterium]